MLALDAASILRCIESNLTSKVMPHLTDPEGRSAVASIRHLLRHVVLRFEHEGQILRDEITILRPLLAQARDYLAGSAFEETALMMSALERPTGETPGHYLTIAEISAQAASLREALYAAQKYLIAVEASDEPKPAYQALREAIRAYIVGQIERESRLIDPAFFGFGPRR